MPRCTHDILSLTHYPFKTHITPCHLLINIHVILRGLCASARLCVFRMCVCVCKPVGHMGLWSTLDLIWSDLISSQLADVEQ